MVVNGRWARTGVYVAAVLLLGLGASAQAGVLAKYDFDQITGNVVSDVSGGNHDITFYRATSLSTDNPFGIATSKSATLNGTGSTVESWASMANCSTININNGGQNKFTVQCWFKAAEVTGNHTFIQTQDTAGGRIILGRSANQFGAYAYVGSTWKGYLSTTTITTGVWYHVAAIYDGGTIRLYVNGVLQGSGLSIGASFGTQCSSVYVGGGGVWGNGKGQLDDLSLSNEMTAVSDLGYYKSFTADSSVLAKFNLDAIGSDGKTVTDVSGNGHDAVFYRATSLSTDDPFTLSQSSSATLNGSVSPAVESMAFLSSPSTINLNNGGKNNATIECWFKPTSTLGCTLVHVTGASGEIFVLGYYTDGKAYIEWIQSGYSVIASTTTLQVGTWYHLAGTYSGSGDGKMRLYVNGQLEGTPLSLGKSFSSGSSQAMLGGGGNFGNGKGQLDDVLIANRAFLPQELGYNRSFSLDVTAAAPKFSPNGGYLSVAKDVTISCDTAGATIKYTTDGNDPTDTYGTVIANNGTVTVDRTMTLKAKAWATGMPASPISRATFTFPTSYNRPADIPYSTNVTVDGNLSEWNTATWAPLDVTYDGTPSDILNASYAARWGNNGNTLYVAVKVQDNAHVFTDTYDSYNTRDAIEVYVHTTGTGPTGYWSTQADAQQYALGIKNSDPNHAAVWTAVGGVAVPDSANLVARGYEGTDGWLYYEMAITPFKFFSLDGSLANTISTLQINDVIGLDVAVVGRAPSGYTGMKSENSMAGKYNDYTKFGIHKIADAMPVRILSVTPASQSIGAAAGTTTFTVANAGDPGMVWTAEVISGGEWLSIANGSSGTDAGTISVDYSDNTGEERTGTIRITSAGATGSPVDVTVVQAAPEPTPTPTPEQQPGDANGDGKVNFSDYLLLSQNFGVNGTPGEMWGQGDFNADGTVNFSDYLILSQNFGTGGSVSAEEVAKFKAASANLTADETSDVAQQTLPCTPLALALMAVIGLALCGLGSSFRK